MTSANSPTSTRRGSPEPRKPVVDVSYDEWSESFHGWLDGPGGRPVRSRVRRYSAILQDLVDDGPVDLIIASDLASTVNRLEPKATPYVVNRGDRGTVGGRTLTHNDRPQVILNGSFIIRTTAMGTAN